MLDQISVYLSVFLGSTGEYLDLFLIGEELRLAESWSFPLYQRTRAFGGHFQNRTHRGLLLLLSLSKHAIPLFLPFPTTFILVRAPYFTTVGFLNRPILKAKLLFSGSLCSLSHLPFVFWHLVFEPRRGSRTCLLPLVASLPPQSPQSLFLLLPFPTRQELPLCHIHFLPSFLRRSLLFPFPGVIMTEASEIARREIHWKVITILFPSCMACTVPT